MGCVYKITFAGGKSYIGYTRHKASQRLSRFDSELSKKCCMSAMSAVRWAKKQGRAFSELAT